jgi:signal transduction histidine kinase
MPAKLRAMARTNSLAFRLLAIAAVWSALGLAGGGWALSQLFTRSAEGNFDTRLNADLDSVIAAADRDPEGKLNVAQSFVDPRFANAFSGWYWQVSSLDPPPEGSETLLRSTSLWDQSLHLGPAPALGASQKGYTIGPRKKRLRYIENVVSIPDDAQQDPAAHPHTEHRYRFVVASDVSDVEAEISTFNITLWWATIVLGVGLLSAMFVQVRLGLAPLGRVSRALAAIREGRADRLEGDFPAEIKPLADELNALVAHNAQVVTRARTHVGNLAHFLKTPLSVLANEAQSAQGPLAEAVMRQVSVMRRQVDHYLARARTVGSVAVIGARTDVSPVVSDLTRALSKLYAPRGVTIDRRCPDGLSFRGDRADLEEMIGNLLDNACKWAMEQVEIVVAPEATGRLKVTVSDDGPGLNGDQMSRVLERGERLDQSKPGSGLGISIVKEIAALYGGTLTLGRSTLGGLMAELNLPAADAKA